MEILRKVKNFELNKGILQASGLFNLYDKKTGNISLWFDEETKDELLKLSNKDFVSSAKQLTFQCIESGLWSPYNNIDN